MGIDPVTVLRVSKCPGVDGRQNVEWRGRCGDGPRHGATGHGGAGLN